MVHSGYGKRVIMASELLIIAHEWLIMAIAHEWLIMAGEMLIMDNEIGDYDY